jgi:hypothetical protein
VPLPRTSAVVVETATVYRAVGGRRYLTRRGALNGYAKAKFRAKHRCECEPRDYADGYGGYECGIHALYDRVMPRYLRWLHRVDKVLAKTP